MLKASIWNPWKGLKLRVRLKRLKLVSFLGSLESNYPLALLLGLESPSLAHALVNLKSAYEVLDWDVECMGGCSLGLVDIF